MLPIYASRPAGLGGAGIVAMKGEVTLDHARVPLADPGQQHAWTNPGGDFLSGSSGRTLINDPDSYKFNGAGSVSDVQFWADSPGLNHGWILTRDESVPDKARQFYSDTTDDQAPRLIVGYSIAAIPEPGFSGLLLTGMAAVRLALSRRR